MNLAKKEFIRCAKCGKNLIVKEPDGRLYFAFGRLDDEDKKAWKERTVAVEIIIEGKVSMRCWRRECRAWNELDTEELRKAGQTI